MTFGDGLAAFSDSFALIRRPGIRTFVWAPALLSLVVIAVGVVLTVSQIDAAVDRLLAALPGWLDFLDYLLTPLAYVLTALLATWLFGYLATIVASPFLGFLAMRVERELTGTAAGFEQGMLAEVLEALRRELRKLRYHLPRALAIFVVTLLPGVNAVAPVLWVVFGGWMVAVQYGDYLSENHGVPFVDTLERLRANRQATLGFGIPTFAVLSVPLLNFVAVPLAVVGGTLLQVRLTRADRPAIA